MIKKVVVVGVLVVVGYYFWSSYAQNPPDIEHPVYAEIRIAVEGQGRELDLVLFAEMVDQNDCRDRSLGVWEEALAACVECNFKQPECKTTLPPQYARLFDDAPAKTTYLSAHKGSRYERNGRIIIWGLTGSEADEICQMMVPVLKKGYQGAVSCIQRS